MIDEMRIGITDAADLAELERLHDALRAVVRPRRSAAPAGLFHYTTSAGLRGILTSGELRATNFAYLNDALEPLYGRYVALETLRDLRDGASTTCEARFLDYAMEAFASSTRDTELYVTCFCEDGDLLSQWRGYGDTSGRYSIQFDTARLQAEDHTFSFGQVIYSHDEQVSIVTATARAAADAILAQRSPSFEDSSDLFWRRVTALLMAHVASDAAFFKPKAFSEEREWRAVRHVYPSDGLAAIEFDATALIRPYTSMFQGERIGDGRILPISKIIVGAHSSAILARKSVRMLLAKLGYATIPVDSTVVSLRP